VVFGDRNNPYLALGSDDFSFGLAEALHDLVEFLHLFDCIVQALHLKLEEMVTGRMVEAPV
jgi:hypothetical protein